MNIFTSNQNFPTLEESGVNWEEIIGESVMQYWSLQAAYANLYEIKQHLVADSPYPGTIDEYVAVVNALEAPRWVKLCAATGIHVLRDMLAGKGYNAGSMTEMSKALQLLGTAYQSTKTPENA